MCSKACRITEFLEEASTLNRVDESSKVKEGTGSRTFRYLLSAAAAAVVVVAAEDEEEGG
jgi:hypothetical protein